MSFRTSFPPTTRSGWRTRSSRALPTPSGARALTAAEFRISAAAADADDRIIYNSTTGAVIYDSNGNVAGGATQFATLPAGLALTVLDFLVF
jgi:hypothetical protein